MHDIGDTKQVAHGTVYNNCKMGGFTKMDFPMLWNQLTSERVTSLICSKDFERGLHECWNLPAGHRSDRLNPFSSHLNQTPSALETRSQGHKDSKLGPKFKLCHTQVPLESFTLLGPIDLSGTPTGDGDWVNASSDVSMLNEKLYNRNLTALYGIACPPFASISDFDSFHSFHAFY